MVSGFFREDQSKVSEFGGKGLFRLCLFCGCSKFSGGGDLGYLFFQRGPLVEEVGSALNDLMESLVGVSMGQELRFFFPSIVFKESGVGDGIDIDMLRGLVGGLLVVRIVVGSVSGMGEIEVF